MYKRECTRLTKRRIASTLPSNEIVEARSVVEDQSVAIMRFDANSKAAWQASNISFKEDSKLFSVSIVIDDQCSLCSGVYGEPKKVKRKRNCADPELSGLEHKKMTYSPVETIAYFVKKSLLSPVQFEGSNAGLLGVDL
jgi:hypothetical protein